MFSLNLMLSFPYISVKVMKNTEGSFAATRMDLDLEISILSEISLRHIYHITCRWNLKKKKKKIQSAQGWCTGMTLRDGMGREVGERLRMGNTYSPMADSWQCMAKALQYCKVISLQLK